MLKPNQKVHLSMTVHELGLILVATEKAADNAEVDAKRAEGFATIQAGHKGIAKQFRDLHDRVRSMIEAINK